MNLCGRETAKRPKERDDKMSRKNDAFNDKMNIGYTESEETDTAALGGEIVDDEINDGEETVDISQFSTAPPHTPAESEEGKR